MNQEPSQSNFVGEVLDFYADQLSQTVDFEMRPQQKALAASISQAFEEGLILLAEAGTGTGKSLAYLIPAVLWTRRYARPIIISTRTLNLQQQLLEKDIPLLQSLFSEPFNVAPARGWSNYVCLRRLYDLPGSGLVEPEIEEQAHELQHELNQGQWGVRQELHASTALWSEVCADSTACNRQMCPYYSGCYLFQERKLLEKADIIVTNHSLVMADLSVRRDGGQGILPTCQALVLDEAHHLEEVANDHLGRSVSRSSCDRLQQQLFRPKSRSEEGGYLPSLRQFITSQIGDPSLKQELLHTLDRELIMLLPDFYASYENFFADLAGLPMGDTQARPNSVSQRFSLKPGMLSGEQGEAILERGARLAASVDGFRSSLSSIANRLAGIFEDNNEGPGRAAGILSELESVRNQLAHFRNDLEFCLFPEDPNWIYWIMLTREDCELGATPLEVGTLLREELFHATRSLVMTSATLTSRGSFEFLRSRLGLEDFDPEMVVDPVLLESDFDYSRIREFCADSPFDYRTQAYLGVAKDLPDPNSADFFDQVMEPLQRLMVSLGGRTFVLLTSYRALKTVQEALTGPLELHGIEMLCQGDAPNAQLLQRFRRDTRCVLLGTDSFWEGVDVPGDALQCVVLARLPFRVPNDPIVEAHCRRLEENGKSSFYEYQLPQAILKLRQGFGRLIRTAKDRGLVIVLDSRLYHKSYGKDFFRSLPACTRRAGPFSEIVTDGLRWLDLN